MRTSAPAFRIAIILLVLLSCSGCWKKFFDPLGIFGGGGEDERPSAIPNRVVDPADKYLLAIGGVASGRDELVIFDGSGNQEDFTGKTLACTADDDIVHLTNRPGFADQASGSGVRIIPIEPGVTAIRCTVDGQDLGKTYEVTVPPQVLIQILVAEALGQLTDEAVLDEDEESDVVTLDSNSPTANPLGSVTRNRINYIISHDDPDLFSADEETFDSDPPVSYYEAVILAEGQYSPTDPSDPNHDLFDDAQDRNFLHEDELIAYDQAVLTAGGIFNGDIADTTTGAFAFMSPTPSEWNTIAQAWSMHYWTVPEGAGFTDATFPAFAPIQILIHPDMWTYDDGRPSFVFARMRTDNDFAVVNVP
ncbi:MAG: hypothetical protein ABH871_06485 [Pseudomonadota bacterium]